MASSWQASVVLYNTQRTERSMMTCRWRITIQSSRRLYLWNRQARYAQSIPVPAGTRAGDTTAIAPSEAHDGRARCSIDPRYDWDSRDPLDGDACSRSGEKE